VVEGGDPDTARAIAESHRALGLSAFVMEDEGRFNIAKFMKNHKARMMKSALKSPNVVVLRKVAK
tara:strand:+ start:3955 stop:4149 length:195 start_codon:yes stop_codon:yes gene_type:complete